jgi:cytochrome b involved in lipid metabolism
MTSTNMETATDSNTKRIIKWDEIKLHDEDAETQWTVVGRDVIDFTEYKYQHPGGDEILLEHAGQDATESFSNVGHSSEARETMKQYIIGTLYEDEVEKTKTKSVNGTDSSPGSENSSSGGGIVSMIKYVVIPALIFGTAYFVQKFIHSSS